METEKFIKPIFKKAGDDDFFKQLHKEVQANILINKNIQLRIIYKSVFFITLYFTFYSCILLFGNRLQLLFLFYILTGLTMILVFFNAFHDAVHGAVFKTRASNEKLSHILELFGSNSYIWKKRHLLLHHPYPNMQQWDIDIKQSDIVRIFPGSKWFNFHRYQHIYMWLLYFFYTLNWLLIRDFKDFFGIQDNYVKRVVNIPKIEYVKLFAAKIFYLLMMIVIPALLLKQPFTNIIVAFLVMHVIASAFGVTALLSTHADENADFPMPPADGMINATWAAYQISNTKDFSTKNPIANFLFGGFNHHVAHHLFPAVAHTYYPYITPIIRRYAREHNLGYRTYPLRDAIRSHFVLLKKNGSRENLFVTGDL
jgi:linoleoyl-CoA desaturase